MTEPPRPLFRVAKRRKIAPRRFNDDANDSDPASSSTPHRPLSPTPASASPPASSVEPEQQRQHPDAEDDTSLSLAEILRRRKAKARKQGIQFSNNAAMDGATREDGDERAVTLPGQSAVEAAITKFKPPTGQVEDVLDKHMMAYIDSKMAERNRGAVMASEQSTNATSDAPTVNSTTAQSWDSQIAAAKKLGERQPAGIGKIQEIDLGPDATRRNIALTEAATRKLYHNSSESETVEKPRKSRLGPDGKPWRNRKRRNSEDLRRDKLVEEVFKENKIDLYDEPSEPSEFEDAEAADDRIAEKFRREFMEAMQTRRQVKKAVPATTAAKPGRVDPNQYRGPKLGGSRSARAAMRAQEEKATKK